MPSTELFDVACSVCDTETAVAVTIWPATRIDPADGETTPEECPKCGHPFGDDDKWERSEPPDREPDDWGPSDAYDPKIDFPERYSDGPF